MYIQEIQVKGVIMRRSTETEIQEVTDLVLSIRAKIKELLQSGKKVHIVWDFDGVLADNRSDDIFALVDFDLETYFAHEERLLFQSPGEGPWLLPIANNAGVHPYFPPDRFTPLERRRLLSAVTTEIADGSVVLLSANHEAPVLTGFTQDIVTARSSTNAIRVHIFCIKWQLPVRWMLFLGHQPKKEAYRIILKSLKSDQNYCVFCIDDKAKHIEAFLNASAEEGMENRVYGIVSPVVRTYTEEELKEYFDRVMRAVGKAPIRVRDPSNDVHGFIVFPGALQQFSKEIDAIVIRKHDEGQVAELRNAFVKVHGEVGKGCFKTEEDLERAMHEFILGLHCP